VWSLQGWQGSRQAEGRSSEGGGGSTKQPMLVECEAVSGFEGGGGLGRGGVGDGPGGVTVK
jgi:hypothetical protein